MATPTKSSSNREHSFDHELAGIVGIEKAILLKNFDYWCKENERRKVVSMQKHGTWWTTESLNSLARKYIYMKRGNLSRWIHQLNEDRWVLLHSGEKGNNFYAPGPVFRAWDSGEDWERVFQNETGRCFKMKQVEKGGVFQNETQGVFQNETQGVFQNETVITNVESNVENDVEINTPVSEKSTVALTTFSPGEKIQNLEVIVVEGETLSLDADSEQTCSGAGGETQQCSTYDLYAALEAKKDKPVRDHDSQILQDFSNLGTQADFEETKRRMTNKANNADAAEIISHLNTVTGSQFRTAAKANVALVNARMKEGATADDLKLIIDHKNEQWGTDAKMREHLCPETLFRAGHYEKYINAARKWQQDKSGPVADRYAMNDSPKAQTPDEMVREMSFFYRTHIHDGDDGRGLLSAAQKHAQTAYGPERLNEVVRAFCSHRIGKGLARETFEQQHGAFCLWLQNEKKREQRGQGGPAVFNPSDLRAQQRLANREE